MTDFDRLGREIAREQDRLRAPGEERAFVREQLLARADVVPGSRMHGRYWLAAAALVCAAALALVFVRDDAPLTAIAAPTGQALPAGAFIAAEAGAPFDVRFSDGTTVQLAPGARARLVELDPDGAHLLLEGGTVRVAVVPRPHTRFRISAGPFVVHVKGTRFDVRWDAEQDRFELDLTRGAVEVSGCVLGQGYRMRAGQHVTASCKRKQFDVIEGERAPAAEAIAPRAAAVESAAVPNVPPAVAAPTASEPSAASQPVRRANRPQPRAASRAASQPRAAETQRFTSSAQFEAQCATATPEQLTEFADGARKAGEFEREAHALRVLRRRYAGTARGALAAYALGRLEFDVYGEHRKAVAWFATYLREEPRGALAREARGRMFEAKALLGEVARARELAAAYLRDYPDGPHAALAQSLLATPDSER